MTTTTGDGRVFHRCPTPTCPKTYGPSTADDVAEWVERHTCEETS